MGDARNEGREEAREEQRVAHLTSLLDSATEARLKRDQRGREVIEKLGCGHLYGGDILIGIEEAEELADRINRLEDFPDV